MVTLLRYSDRLRAIGRLLDEQGARQPRIIDDGDCLRVRWRDAVGVEDYRELDSAQLEALCRRARSTRGRAGEGAAPAQEELLRTLGQEIEAQGLQVLTIREDHGLRLSAMAAEGPTTRWFSKDELLAKNAERRALRRTTSRRRWPFWPVRGQAA